MHALENVVATDYVHTGEISTVLPTVNIARLHCVRHIYCLNVSCGEADFAYNFTLYTHSCE